MNVREFRRYRNFKAIIEIALFTLNGCQLHTLTGLNRQSSSYSKHVVLPAPAHFTDLDGFSMIYLMSAEFDYCGKVETGEKFRKILEDEYNICLSGEDKDEKTLLDIRRQIKVDDTEIAIRAHKTAKLPLECTDFLSDNLQKSLAVSISKVDTSAALSELPSKCGDPLYWTNQTQQIF
jgi:hypothetical protein